MVKREPTEAEIEEAYSQYEDYLLGPHVSLIGLQGLPSFQKEKEEIDGLLRDREPKKYEQQ